MPCGYGIDIPGILQFHAKAEAKGLLPDDSLSADNSSYRKASKIYLSKYNQAVSDKHQAHRCIRCWHCMGACPNQIFIVDELKHITALTDKMRDSLCYE
jgi:predicted aldo/keto reductase-like oxidoreductase